MKAITLQIWYMMSRTACTAKAGGVRGGGGRFEKGVGVSEGDEEGRGVVGVVMGEIGGCPPHTAQREGQSVRG